MKTAVTFFRLLLLLFTGSFSSLVQAQELVFVRQGMLWGIMNSRGEMVQKPQFDGWFPVFHQQEAFAVSVNGKWGLLNAKGQLVTKPQYDRLYWYPAQPKEPEFVKFRIGGAPTPDGRTYCGGKMGILDPSGNVLIEPTYDYVYWNSWLQCFVLSNDRYGNYCDHSFTLGSYVYADKTGKLLTAGPDELLAKQNHPVAFKEEEMGGKFGYRKGSGTIIPFVYDDIVPEVRNGVVAVNRGSRAKNDGYYGERTGGKWGLVNLKNEVVVPLHYDEVRFLNNSRLAVRKDKKWGLFDTGGRQILPLEFENIFSSGRENKEKGFALTARKYDREMENNLFQLINADGSAFTREQFNTLVYQNKGDYWIAKRDDKFFFLDARGEATPLAFPANFHTDLYQLQRFDRNSLISGSAQVGQQGKPVFSQFFIGGQGGLFPAEKYSDHTFGILLQQGKKWGFLDSAGVLQMETKFDTVVVSPTGLNWGKLNGQWHLYAGPGKLVKTLPAEVEEVRPFVNGYAAVSSGGIVDAFGGRQNSKWGFVNGNGELVIDCRYEAVKDFGKDCSAVQVPDPTQPGSRVRNGFKWTLVGKDGKQVWPHFFDDIEY